MTPAYALREFVRVSRRDQPGRPRADDRYPLGRRPVFRLDPGGRGRPILHRW